LWIALTIYIDNLLQLIIIVKFYERRSYHENTNQAVTFLATVEDGGKKFKKKVKQEQFESVAPRPFTTYFKTNLSSHFKLSTMA